MNTIAVEAAVVAEVDTGVGALLNVSSDETSFERGGWGRNGDAGNEGSKKGGKLHVYGWTSFEGSWVLEGGEVKGCC